jgi:hypothetical protein
VQALADLRAGVGPVADGDGAGIGLLLLVASGLVDRQVALYWLPELSMSALLMTGGLGEGRCTARVARISSECLMSLASGQDLAGREARCTLELTMLAMPLPEPVPRPAAGWAIGLVLMLPPRLLVCWVIRDEMPAPLLMLAKSPSLSSLVCLMICAEGLALAVVGDGSGITGSALRCAPAHHG